MRKFSGFEGLENVVMEAVILVSDVKSTYLTMQEFNKSHLKQ